MSAEAHAANVLANMETHTVIFPLPTSRDLAPLSKKQTVELFLRLRLLRPLEGRACVKCKQRKKERPNSILGIGFLKVQYRPRLLDGMRLKCSVKTCSATYGIREGSIFERSMSPLAEAARQIAAYEQHVYMSTEAKLAGKCVDSMRLLWNQLRQRTYEYMQSHPVMFEETDIVEIDECYLKFMQEEGSHVTMWIIGMIARGSNKCHLELCETHATWAVHPIISAHVKHPKTITITDKHLSFKFLETETEHWWVEKRKTNGRIWMKVDNILILDHYGAREPSKNVNKDASFDLHSNTIEGFWSHFRRELRGVQKETLKYYLAEIMFRRLRLPITHILQV
jgi:hypothetical protein